MNGLSLSLDRNLVTSSSLGSGRKMSVDAEIVCVEDEQMLQAGGVLRLSRRENLGSLEDDVRNCQSTQTAIACC